MTAAPIARSDFQVSGSHQKHMESAVQNPSRSHIDHPTAYRMWFRDLLWRAFPAGSDAARAERAARVLDVSERQVRNWLRCEHDPKLRYVMAVIAIAGAEVVFK